MEEWLLENIQAMKSNDVFEILLVQEISTCMVYKLMIQARQP